MKKNNGFLSDYYWHGNDWNLDDAYFTNEKRERQKHGQIFNRASDFAKPVGPLSW